MDSQRIWSNFSIKSADGRNIPLIIREWPMEKLDAILDFFLKYFVTGEAMHIAAGISENEEALVEYRMLLTMLLREKKHDISVCCLNDDSQKNDIIGISITEIMKRGETLPDMQLQSKELLKLKEILFNLGLEFNAAETLDVDEYHCDKGVCVRPDYRCLGIAQKMLHIRRLICKEPNIPFTSAWMTAFGTQKAAARDNWETVFELDLEKFGQKVDADFKHAPPTFKFMIARV